MGHCSCLPFDGHGGQCYISGHVRLQEANLMNSCNIEDLKHFQSVGDRDSSHCTEAEKQSITPQIQLQHVNVWGNTMAP